MVLYRRNMATPVFGLRREIDRLFDEALGGNGLTANWIPSAEISEDQGEIRLCVELPGVQPKDVEITAENGVLSIRGQKNEERKEGDDNRYYLSERTFGAFTRSFQLPQGINEDKITADFQHGVLTVHIPKAALPQPKRIHIEPGAGTQRQTVEAGKQQIEADHK